MRIISKFTDVYDLQNSLYDPSRVWTRTTDTIKVLAKDSPKLVLKGYIDKKPEYYLGRDYFVFYIQMVFFAGKVFPLYTIEYGGKKAPDYINQPGFPYEDFYTFDFDTFASRVEVVGKSMTLAYNCGISSFSTDIASVLKKLEAGILDLIEPATRCLEELRQPILLVDKQSFGLLEEKDTQQREYWEILTNFCFNELRLPWQEIQPNLYIFHQQLEQYIFGTLGNKEPEMVYTSDKTRLEAHGFSSKFSFRNMERD